MLHSKHPMRTFECGWLHAVCRRNCSGCGPICCRETCPAARLLTQEGDGCNPEHHVQQLECAHQGQVKHALGKEDDALPHAPAAQGRRRGLGWGWGAGSCHRRAEAAGCGVFQHLAPPRCQAHLGSGRLSRRNRVRGTGRIQFATMRQIVAILTGSVLAGGCGRRRGCGWQRRRPEGRR